MVSPKFTVLPGMLAIAALTLPPAAIAVDPGDWLDAEVIPNWNSVGADIPAAPDQETDNFEYCSQTIREAQVPEDEAVMAAGWTLFGPIQMYGETTVVMGMANADGMCRPLLHQTFVFVDGQFAGTLSPFPMNSRTDGNLVSMELIRGDYLRGLYQRYEPTDALCCPSAESYLFFTVEEDNGLPLVTPQGPAS